MTVPLVERDARQRARRRSAIVLLLGSLGDFRFEPLTATGRIVRSGAGRAARATEWRDCGACAGRGKSLRGVRCDPCRGSGRVKVDQYTGERVAALEHVWTFAELLERDTRSVRCDRCDGSGAVARGRCRSCDGSGRVVVPGSWLSDPERERSGDDPESAMLAAVERRGEVGSYRELERALSRLRLADRGAYLGVVEAFVGGGVVGSAAERGLVFLEERMPEPVVVPAGVRAADRRAADALRRVRRPSGVKALEARDREIRRLARDGRSAQWLAAEFGLSVRRVYEIGRGR